MQQVCRGHVTHIESMRNRKPWYSAPGQEGLSGVSHELCRLMTDSAGPLSVLGAQVDISLWRSVATRD